MPIHMPLSHLRGVPLNKTGFHVKSKILAAVFVLCRCHISAVFRWTKQNSGGEIARMHVMLKNDKKLALTSSKTTTKVVNKYHKTPKNK